ncbi:hypothetical protein PKHYL_01650 [Psychrobacter sp. KH172YL61]|uniref:hypothetical protein n=1 Tax=Psychrobacter sp. KH172YL61 TaxID=2517899 RepID=UPI0010BA48E2|nr:hypothetical protein [Psychrobacter sp. KH172YL61]BBI65974.1 hypothetical protein PKHYL_01650 [Psychrobacter sp. KH172YL61]
MFRLLPVKPNVDTSASSALAAVALTGVLFLTGCQQQADAPPVSDEAQTTEKTSEEDSQPMQQSDSAAARIEQFQPIYVAQAQGLQRRLQAEYESLEAADTSDSEESLLLNGATNDSATLTENANSANSEPLPADSPVEANATSEEGSDTEMNTSTEVGERDLTVLKRISLEPRKPIILTEEQIIERYQQTMAALYQPVTTPLSAEDADTLINIATLVPQLFEHAEIAGRGQCKKPCAGSVDYSAPSMGSK